MWNKTKQIILYLLLLKKMCISYGMMYYRKLKIRCIYNRTSQNPPFWSAIHSMHLIFLNSKREPTKEISTNLALQSCSLTFCGRTRTTTFRLAFEAFPNCTSLFHCLMRAFLRKEVLLRLGDFMGECTRFRTLLFSVILPERKELCKFGNLIYKKIG